MKPNKGVILIEVDKAQIQDASGVYVIEEWKRNPPTGTVLAVGEDVSFVKEGDRVFFARYAAIQTPFGEDIKACKEEHILSKYE